MPAIYKLLLARDMRIFGPLALGSPMLINTEQRIASGECVHITATHVLMYDHRPQLAVKLLEPVASLGKGPHYLLIEEFSDDVQMLAMLAGMHFATYSSKSQGEAAKADARRQFDSAIAEIAKVMRPRVSPAPEAVQKPCASIKPMAEFDLFL